MKVVADTLGVARSNLVEQLGVSEIPCMAGRLQRHG